MHFYPRSPCGERPVTRVARTPTTVISIHALLAESDRQGRNGQNIERRHNISIHALLAESDVNSVGLIIHIGGFLSTLSLRRATPTASRRKTTDMNFYPRSPCGERPPRGDSCYLDNIISIHALLAESDRPPAPPRQEFYKISIHALLAESDASNQEERQ